MRVLGAVDMAEGDSERKRIQTVSQMTFTDEDGHPRQFIWRTIQTWYSRFKKHGVTEMENKPRSDKGKVRKVVLEDVLEAILLKNTKDQTLRPQSGQPFQKTSNRACTTPVRSRPEPFIQNASLRCQHGQNPRPIPTLHKWPEPSQAYDQSAVIRSRFTTGARTLDQLPCDANLVESTLGKKSVTFTAVKTFRGLSLHMRPYLASRLDVRSDWR